MDWKSGCRTCISSWWACNWKYHHLLSTQLQRNDSLCDQLLLLSLGPELVHNSCKSCTFSHILVALILSYLSSPPSSLLPFLSVQPQLAWILLCLQPRISLVSSSKSKGRARKQWGVCFCGNKHNIESCPFSFSENWVESVYKLRPSSCEGGDKYWLLRERERERLMYSISWEVSQEKKGSELKRHLTSTSPLTFTW